MSEIRKGQTESRPFEPAVIAAAIVAAQGGPGRKLRRWAERVDFIVDTTSGTSRPEATRALYAAKRGTRPSRQEDDRQRRKSPSSTRQATA